MNNTERLPKDILDGIREFLGVGVDKDGDNSADGIENILILI